MSVPVFYLNNSPAMWPGEPVPTDAEIEFSRLRFCKRNQLLHVVGGKAGIGHHDLRNHGDEADRGEVLFDVERQLVVELWIDGMRRQRQQNRITVGRGLGRKIGADIAGRATAIVDDDRLAELGGQGLADDPGDDVRAAPRGVRHDDPDRSGRIILRGRKPC